MQHTGAYGGIASANSAVLGSKGLCNSSSLDLLIVSQSTPGLGDTESHVLSLLVEFIVLHISPFERNGTGRLTTHKAWRID